MLEQQIVEQIHFGGIVQYFFFYKFLPLFMSLHFYFSLLCGPGFILLTQSLEKSARLG